MDPTILLNANYGNLSEILTSDVSLWDNKGYETTNVYAVDNCARTLTTGTQATFSGEDRFRFRKRGARVHKAWLRLSISAGVVAVANRAAFVDDLAANIIKNLRLEYSSKTLQEYSGEAVKFYSRLIYHDVFREHYNAQGFAGLPPGAGGAEAQREALCSNAFTLFVPLTWLFFTRTEDYAFTPEALASEVDIVVKYEDLEKLVYARVILTGATVAADPFTTRPIITKAELCHQLIFTEPMEKQQHLGKFEARQGMIYKILDFEVQLNTSVPAAAGVYSIKLDNLRLDSHFVMFTIRSSTINTNWAIDKTMSDPTATILSGGGSVAALQALTSFRLLANGQTIVDTVTDIENRSIWRDIYFPGGQLADFVYFIPFAWLLREVKNVTGYQNLANLGTLELELTLPVSGTTRIVDVWNICHNAIQKRKGDVIKAVR